MSSVLLSLVPVGKAFDFSGDSYTLVKHNSVNAVITDGRHEMTLNRRAIVQNVREPEPVVEKTVEEEIAEMKRVLAEYKAANPDALFEGESGRVVCVNSRCAGMTLQGEIVFSGKTRSFIGLGYERYSRMSPAAVKRWRDEVGTDGLCDCKAVK